MYELRRELLRLQSANSLQLLDAFIGAEANRYLRLTDPQLRHAAQLWADVRAKGRPTAHRHAMDIDVILAAQALSLGLATSDFVVATSNVSHFDVLVPAKEWQSI